MKKYIILSFLAGIVLVSCKPKEFIQINQPAAQITDLHYFMPHASIYLVESGNRGFPNDSISLISSELLEMALREVTAIPLKGKVTFQDKDVESDFNFQLSELMLSFDQSDYSDRPGGTRLADKELSRMGKRYGLVTMADAFTRDAGASRGGSFFGGMVLGRDVSSKAPYSTTIYTYVVDALRDSVVYYNRVQADMDPLSKETYKFLLNEAFKGYFTPVQ